MLKQVELKHYMVQNPVKVRADANLLDAIHLILVNKISGLCVVDERNKLIGVLSETDCLRGVLSATYNDSGIGSVGEFMTAQNLHTASPGDHIVDIAADMLTHKIRRRPVIDKRRHAARPDHHSPDPARGEGILQPGGSHRTRLSACAADAP
jgi:CBS domain-containing protein